MNKEGWIGTISMYLLFFFFNNWVSHREKCLNINSAINVCHLVNFTLDQLIQKVPI